MTIARWDRSREQEGIWGEIGRIREGGKNWEKMGRNAFLRCAGPGGFASLSCFYLLSMVGRNELTLMPLIRVVPCLFVQGYLSHCVALPATVGGSRGDAGQNLGHRRWPDSARSRSRAFGIHMVWFFLASCKKTWLKLMQDTIPKKNQIFINLMDHYAICLVFLICFVLKIILIIIILIKIIIWFFLGRKLKDHLCYLKSSDERLSSIFIKRTL